MYHRQIQHIRNVSIIIVTEALMSNTHTYNINCTCSFDTVRLTSNGSSVSEKDVMAFFSLESGWQYLQYIQNSQVLEVTEMLLL